MSSSTTTTTWLTQEAHDRLSAELEHLSGPAREDVVRKIEAAREEGDLKENGGYHAAKDEQGKQEARVRQLKQLLQDVVTGPSPATEGVVSQGSVVTVDYGTPSSPDLETFLFASRENAGAGGKVTVDGEQVDVYSPESPIGQAIDGHGVGESLTFGPRSTKVAITAARPWA